MATATEEVTQERRKRIRKHKEPRADWGNRTPEGHLVEKLTWSPGQATPEGYSVKTHNPLTRSDFATLGDFYEFRADELDRKAKGMRQAAADERSGKGKSIKNKQKKFLKLKDLLKSLGGELEADGIDLSALVN